MTDQPDSREVERVAVALANYECAKLDLTPLTGIDDFRHDYEREEYKSLARAAIAALATTGARVAELEAALRAIVEGDVPRPEGIIEHFCTHDFGMAETCQHCISDFARAALAH